MPDVKDVDAIADFGLTLDHFYGLVKQQVGNLEARQYVQLQATAVPLDISEAYRWFSLGNLNAFFDVRLDPTAVPDNVTLLSNAKLSDQYLMFMAELLALVEIKELDGPTLKRIDELQTQIANNGSRINALLRRRMDDWLLYAQATMLDRGSLAVFTHWSQGYHLSREISDLEHEQAREQALISALRIRKYTDPSHQAVVDAYAAVTGPAARVRYPRFEDKDYGPEAAKFNAVYFASLPDNDSSLFANRQIMNSRTSITTLATGSIGSFSDAITRQSEARSDITTDWSVSGSGGWGPFKFSANASSHKRIKEDFVHLQSITVGAKSLQAVPIDATAWFRPEMFKHKLVKGNRRLFDPYLGQRGTLLYYPTSLIIARGLNLKFTSSQDWQYDYESDFSSGGSASAKIFGVGWGGGGKYSQSKKEQKIERRDHDLLLDDGENIRILGYIATKNSEFDEDFVNAMDASMMERFELAAS